MKTLLYFKNRIQTAVNPINVGLTAVFIFLTVKDGILAEDGVCDNCGYILPEGTELEEVE